MNEEERILKDLEKVADNSVFVVCSSQEELDKTPKYTANFLSVNDRQARILLKLIDNKDKEIEELKAEIKELNDDNVWWTNRFNAVERDNERLNNIIKEVKSQLDYLETYSSKEDVFEDMKRRLDRIDKIIGSDKE